MAPRLLGAPRRGRARRSLRDVLSPRTVTFLLIVGLVVFQVVVAVTAPRWARFLRRPVPAGVGDEETEATSATPTPSGELAERRINVKLFFGGVENPGLVLEERAVPYRDDLAEQLRHVVEELVRGPTTDLLPLIPSETRVLDVVVTPTGDAFVDLSRDAAPVQGTGSQEEMLTVYSIVNTLTTNFPAVRRVQILLDDQAVETLAGHTSLARPLRPDMTLLAAVPLLPVAGAGESGENGDEADLPVAGDLPTP
jgi:hypothetical protein